MVVDQARHDQAAGGVDLLVALQAGADGDDRLPVDQHVGIERVGGGDDPPSPDETAHPRKDKGVRPLYVIWYTGPSPPSGGVRRPPLAVIAPHCTQLEGLTIRSIMPSSGASSGTS